MPTPSQWGLRSLVESEAWKVLPSLQNYTNSKSTDHPLSHSNGSAQLYAGYPVKRLTADGKLRCHPFANMMHAQQPRSAEVQAVQVLQKPHAKQQQTMTFRSFESCISKLGRLCLYFQVDGKVLLCLFDLVLEHLQALQEAVPEGKPQVWRRFTEECAFLKMDPYSCLTAPTGAAPWHCAPSQAVQPHS